MPGLSCLIQAYMNDTVPKQIDAFGGLRQRDWWPSLWPFHKYEPSLSVWNSGGWALRHSIQLVSLGVEVLRDKRHFCKVVLTSGPK